MFIYRHLKRFSIKRTIEYLGKVFLKMIREKPWKYLISFMKLCHRIMAKEEPRISIVQKLKIRKYY
jgi:hypothetical protein